MDNATFGIDGVSLKYNSKKLQFEKPIHCWLWVVTYCRKNKFRILTNKPLSRNIYEQIRAVISPKKVSSRELYDAIGFHVNSIKYLNRIRAGAQRFNLWGKPDGRVTESEADHARKRMVELHSMYLRSRRKNKKQGIIINQKVGRGTRQSTSDDKGDKPKRVLTLNKTK